MQKSIIIAEIFPCPWHHVMQSYPGTMQGTSVFPDCLDGKTGINRTGWNK
jgi:hypothetical protein